jgi:2-methylisocitrate lyase-like PEP mutase family enzyme
MSNQHDRARQFHELHHRKRLLVLPNAWDVPSARVFEDSGFPAVATSSAGMLVSLGFPDGESIGRKEFVNATERIVRVVSIPVSADIVAGFGRTPGAVATTARGIIATGAVGVNLEDLDGESGRLFPIQAQVKKIQALQTLAESLGIPFVVNARTDAFRHGPGGERARFQEAIRRGIAYRDAGADCLYPMGLVDPESIGEFVRSVEWPTNVMIRPGVPSIRELERLGVARLSFGPSASYAVMGLLKRASKALLQDGNFDALVDGAITFDELNALAVPKRIRRARSK